MRIQVNASPMDRLRMTPFRNDGVAKTEIAYGMHLGAYDINNTVKAAAIPAAIKYVHDATIHINMGVYETSFHYCLTIVPRSDCNCWRTGRWASDWARLCCSQGSAAKLYNSSCPSPFLIYRSPSKSSDCMAPLLVGNQAGCPGI